jgi:hypothetical protein
VAEHGVVKYETLIKRSLHFLSFLTKKTGAKRKTKKLFLVTVFTEGEKVVD